MNANTPLTPQRKKTLRTLVAMRRRGTTPAQQVKHLIQMGVKGEPTPANEIEYLGLIQAEYEATDKAGGHALDLKALDFSGTENKAELERTLDMFKRSE